MRRIIAAVSTAAAFMAAPAVASADSGSITNVVAVGNGQVQATYTATWSTCTSSGYCGWFPEASQVPADQSCGTSTSLDMTYVGNVQGDSGTTTATDSFYPIADSVRLCLYVYQDGEDHLVADYVYTAPPPTPPLPSPSPVPSPAPAPPRALPLTISDAKASLSGILRAEYHSGFTHRKHFERSCYRYSTQKIRCDVRWEHGRFLYSGPVTMWSEPASPADGILYVVNIRWKRVPPLTISEAKAGLSGVLRARYHSRFTHRKHFRRSCYRYTPARVRCHVRWDHGRFRYSGTVTMRNDPSDRAYRFLYSVNIHRKRLHSAKPQAPAPSGPSCDPNYSGCLDPYASDYDCLGGSGDGPRYTGEVRVLGDDHYDLDRDGDGVACEP